MKDHGPVVMYLHRDVWINGVNPMDKILNEVLLIYVDNHRVL